MTENLIFCFSCQDGDTSSTTSSVEVMAEEEVPRSESLTGSSTGPKFVLRLASREHLGLYT